METFVKGLAYASMVVMVAVFILASPAAASVFTVTDESRGLVNMHHELVVCP